MTRFSLLGVAGYFAAAVLVFLPQLDILLSVLPLRVGDMTWRFGTIGVLAGSVMTTVLGLFLALGVAACLKHRRMVKLTGVVSALGFLIFLGLMAMFLLDTMSMRALVTEEAASAFDIAWVSAFFKHACGALGAGLVALAARAEVKAIAPAGGGNRGGGIVSSAGRKAVGTETAERE